MQIAKASKRWKGMGNLNPIRIGGTLGLQRSRLPLSEMRLGNICLDDGGCPKPRDFHRPRPLRVAGKTACGGIKTVVNKRHERDFEAGIIVLFHVVDTQMVKCRVCAD